jgi:hypothetical protein
MKRTVVKLCLCHETHTVMRSWFLVTKTTAIKLCYEEEQNILQLQLYLNTFFNTGMTIFFLRMTWVN